VRGLPSARVCPCGQPAQEWASLGNDHDDPQDYVAKCRACHRLEGKADKVLAHDRREDHPYTGSGAKAGRCSICKARRDEQATEQRRASKGDTTVSDNTPVSAEWIAEHLGVSIHTIRRAFRTGSLPGRKVGKSWTTTRAALDLWLVSGNDGDAPLALETSPVEVESKEHARPMPSS
jgi:hypothetical protein